MTEGQSSFHIDWNDALGVGMRPSVLERHFGVLTHNTHTHTYARTHTQEKENVSLYTHTQVHNKNTSGMHTSLVPTIHVAYI